MSYGTVQAEKMTTESGYSLGAGNASSFKNRIINGAMTFDQRNNGASVTYPGSESVGSNLYTLDRWVCNSTGSTRYSVQRSTTAPTGFTNSVLITTTTAGTPGASDACYFGQYLEGFNVSDLGFGASGAQSVSISFWVRSSLTGLFGAVLANTDFSRRYAFGFTINSSNTWEYKTITIPGDTSGTWEKGNGRGFTLLFNLGGGSSSKGAAGSWTSNVTYPTGSVDLVATAGATLNLTGVQLEVGTVATSFDYRPYSTEYQLCLRYTFVWSSFGGSFVWLGTSGFTSSTGAFVNYVFPVQMRATPTTSFSDQNKWIADYFNGNVTSTAISASFGTPNSVRINIAASPPANYPCFIANNGDAGTRTITFNSEL